MTPTPPDKDELDEILGYLNMKMPLPTTANEGKQRVAALQEAKQAINRLIAKERLDEVKKFDLNMEAVYASDPQDSIVYVKKMAQDRIATLEQSLKEWR